MPPKHRKLLKITDNDGLIEEGKRLWKAHHYDRKHNIIYEEVNPEEYDTRIEKLTQEIVKCPGVDLTTVLKDALYDLPLKLLGNLERKTSKALAEAQKAKEEPKVKTRTKNRGTCVDLVIGNKFALNIRE